MSAPTPNRLDLAPAQPALLTDLPGRRGVRLDQFQLLNWGTYDGAVQRLVLDGGNALMTGQVGAGKSTVVDGLTTLFAATNKVTFNQAAGADRTERSLATYVLGQYRTVKDEAAGTARVESLRTAKTAYSVLLARFLGVPGTGAGALTAGAVFWFGDAPTPNRLYFTAPGHLDIGEHLTGHRDIKAVRAALRTADAELWDTFARYQKGLCRALAVTPAALELLVQTISMKQVGNLTDFVRAHMLDAADVRERITGILDHYRDLSRSHELVQVAREQLEMLAPVVDQGGRYQRAGARVASNAAAAAAVPRHVETRRVDLLAAAVADLDQAAPALAAQLQSAQRRLGDQEARRTQLAVAVQNEGGAELTEARHLLQAAQDRLAAVRRDHAALTALTRTVNLAAPQGAADHDRFLAAVADADTALSEESARLRQADFDAQSALADARRDLDTARAELAAAGSRDSNVPLEDATVRARLAAALGLEPAALPFAAELIAVAEHAAEWEAAAERLTRPFALSLLVPEQHYAAVAAWVDAHHLGRVLTYYRVPALAPVSGPAQPGTVAACLQVRDGSPVSAWLRAEVNRRYDHVCVPDAPALARHPRAVTRAGQVKDHARHVKDDRRPAQDRRYYVLGWDTAARRAALQAQLPALEARVQERTGAANTVGADRAGHHERTYALRQIRERFTDPAAVDVAAAVDALRSAQELHDALADSPDLKTLLAAQSECERAISALKDELSRRERAVGVNTDRRQRYAAEHATASQRLADMPAPDLTGEPATALTEAIGAAGPGPTAVEGCEDWGRAVLDSLHGRAESARATRERAARFLIGAMKDFALRWPEAVTDLPTGDPDAHTEFAALRERLERDDLPAYEENFREQLEHNAIHELVAFSNFLDREAKKIASRIETINGALADIDYQPGTYIRLEAEPSVDAVVREFRGQLREITANALLGEDDTYAEARFLKVKDLLDRFAGRDGSTSADAAWTARVTDVRNWYGFAASERTRADDVAVEHYADSSGLSGGQKEKLAYTILAAALSYQYGLAGGHVDAFRFVMIDEAFGRGSDESTRFGLELFDRLGLQLLVVTPLQKVTIIDPFVTAVGYVRADGDRSRLLSLTVEEYREQRARRAAARQAARAARTTLDAPDLDGTDLDADLDGAGGPGAGRDLAAGGRW